MLDALFWSIILMVVGLGLIAMELFIPSGGVLSALAAVAFIGSVMVAFSGGITSGVIVLAGTLVLLPVILAAAVRWWPYTPLGRLMVLHTPEPAPDGAADTPEHQQLLSLVGRQGVAKTKLLPSGAVRIEGRTYDALSEGTAIDQGQPVRVKAVRANRIVVAAVRTGSPDPPAMAVEPDVPSDPLDQPAEDLGLESLQDPPL